MLVEHELMVVLPDLLVDPFRDVFLKRVVWDGEVEGLGWR
jgi:hypothetical protein